MRTSYRNHAALENELARQQVLLTVDFRHESHHLNRYPRTQGSPCSCADKRSEVGVDDPLRTLDQQMNASRTAWRMLRYKFLDGAVNSDLSSGIVVGPKKSRPGLGCTRRLRERHNRAHCQQQRRQHWDTSPRDHENSFHPLFGKSVREYASELWNVNVDKKGWFEEGTSRLTDPYAAGGAPDGVSGI